MRMVPEAPNHIGCMDIEKICKIFFNMASLSKCPDICWGLDELKCALAWTGLLEAAYEASSRSGDHTLERVFLVRMVSQSVRFVYDVYLKRTPLSSSSAAPQA